MAPSSRKSSHLVLRAQTGDRAALDLLFEQEQKGLYLYLVGVTGDRHLAEDLLQETLLLCMRKLRWLRDPRFFRPWIHRVATREAWRALRAQKRWRGVALEEEWERRVPALEAEPVEVELGPHLERLLERLSPASRSVLLLRYRQGLSLAEIADVLELPLGTVKSRLGYGLATLREQTESNNPDRKQHP